MLFNTLKFFVFFTAVYALYRVLPHRWQNRLLLLSSYYFYGSWDWRFLSLLWITTLFDFVCARRIAAAESRRAKRFWLIVSLSINLGVLGFFKYFNFFAHNFQAVASSVGWHVDPLTLRVILPIGISFYTFQSISYVMDVYRGDMAPVRRLEDYAAFVAFFPQLVAGPISRAPQLAPQIINPRPRRLSAEQCREALWLIVWGLFKKSFVADNLAPWVDGVFANSGAGSGAEALLGVYAFALQIYGDFAGYSDMARGLAKLLGVELVVNFRHPYFVTNPSDFWRNWHISLSTWLRDYLYIPLGGNRHGALATYRNLALTMLLGGLWHGAAWTFVAWGAYQGLLLIAHRLVQPVLQRHAVPASHPWRPVMTAVETLGLFHLTCLGWLLFRASSLTQAAAMLHNVFFHPVPTPQAWRLLAAVLFYGGWFSAAWAAAWLLRRSWQRAWLRPAAAGVLAGCMTYLLVFHRVATRAFIYFQF